jgi:cell division septum initiation protein DivIVA
MGKVNKWTTENVNALKKRLKALRQKVAEAKDSAARSNLEEVIALKSSAALSGNHGRESSLNGHKCKGFKIEQLILAMLFV